MSSIMDELKTLQGTQRPTSVRDAPGPGLDDAAHAAASRPSVARRLYERRRLVGALLAVLVVLVVALIAMPRGGRARSREHHAANDTPAARAPESGTPPAGDLMAATTTETASEAPETVGGAEGTPAVVDEPTTAGDAVAGVEASEPSTSLSLLLPYVAPTFEQGEPAESKMTLSLLMPYTAPTFSAPSVPQITQEEDEANKAAIRALEVRAVLGDEHGIGLYTSEGHLREGSSFHGMVVTTITTRYVVFEYGPKRYKWPLPR